MIELVRSRHKTAQLIQGVWLVTFGDLLTLLLCFFVVGFSYDVRITSNEPRSLEKVEGRLAVVGTSLAHPDGELQVTQPEIQPARKEQPPVLKFTQKDLGAAFTLNQESIQRVIEMYRNTAATHDLTVSGCAWSEEVAGATFERALLRQFLDAGIRSARLRFGLPRPCTDETVLTVSHGG